MKNTLESFNKVCLEYPGNSNSLHKLGTDSKRLEDQATKQILELLNLNNKEIIYTSGRCESNNLLIFGLLEKYKNKNKEVIISNLDDLSIKKSLYSLKEYSFLIHEISSIEELNSLINKNTVLVNLTGLEVSNDYLLRIKKNYKTHIFIDMSEEFNNNLDLSLLDFITIDAQTFESIKGIGVLIKSKNIVIEPLLHGGKSTSIYRSGTPALPFIVSFAKAVKLSINKNIQ